MNTFFCKLGHSISLHVFINDSSIVFFAQVK